MSFYNGLIKVARGPIKLLFRIKIKGRENLPPKEDGFLICANHTSLTDVFVLAASVNRQIYFMAKAELFKIPVLSPLIRALGAFPVNRGGADVSSIKRTVSLITDGKTVGIFPQGTRHIGEDPRQTEVRHGVGLISYRAKCGIIPVFIKTKRRQVKLFRRTEVLIGKPIPYEELGFSDGGMHEYKAAAEYAFDKICTIGETAYAEEAEKNKKD